MKAGEGEGGGKFVARKKKKKKKKKYKKQEKAKKNVCLFPLKWKGLLKGFLGLH